MNTRNPLNVASLILVIIGALNWGIVGLFQKNLVDAIFGSGSVMSRVIYTLVGIAGIYLLYPLLFGSDRANYTVPHAR